MDPDAGTTRNVTIHTLALVMKTYSFHGQKKNDLKDFINKSYTVIIRNGP